MANHLDSVAKGLSSQSTKPPKEMPLLHFPNSRRPKWRRHYAVVCLLMMCVCLILRQSTPIQLIQYARSDNSNWIFCITPTHRRLTQKADLTRLAQALRGVRNLHWIVVEDGRKPSTLVRRLLRRSAVGSYTHLVVPTDRNLTAKGSAQRNFGIQWLRDRHEKEHLKPEDNQFLFKMDTHSVVYFADDDNAFDARVFDRYIRNVQRVGVWAVGFAGGALVETVVTKNGRAVGWHTFFRPKRPFAVDMAGFAVNLELLLERNATFGTQCNRQAPECCLIQQLNVSLADLEVFGTDNKPAAELLIENSTESGQREVLVWHIKSDINGHRNGGSLGYEV